MLAGVHQSCPSVLEPGIWIVLRDFNSDGFTFCVFSTESSGEMFLKLFSSTKTSSTGTTKLEEFYNFDLLVMYLYNTCMSKNILGIIAIVTPLTNPLPPYLTTQ